MDKGCGCGFDRYGGASDGIGESSDAPCGSCGCAGLNNVTVNSVGSKRISYEGGTCAFSTTLRFGMSFYGKARYSSAVNHDYTVLPVDSVGTCTLEGKDVALHTDTSLGNLLR